VQLGHAQIPGCGVTKPHKDILWPAARWPQPGPSSSGAPAPQPLHALRCPPPPPSAQQPGQVCLRQQVCRSGEGAGGACPSCHPHQTWRRRQAAKGTHVQGYLPCHLVLQGRFHSTAQHSTAQHSRQEGPGHAADAGLGSGFHSSLTPRTPPPPTHPPTHTYAHGPPSPWCPRSRPSAGRCCAAPRS
jgi:hypothetical protein